MIDIPTKYKKSKEKIMNTSRNQFTLRKLKNPSHIDKPRSEQYNLKVQNSSDYSASSDMENIQQNFSLHFSKYCTAKAFSPRITIPEPPQSYMTTKQMNNSTSKENIHMILNNIFIQTRSNQAGDAFSSFSGGSNKINYKEILKNESLGYTSKSHHEDIIHSFSFKPEKEKEELVADWCTSNQKDVASVNNTPKKDQKIFTIKKITNRKLESSLLISQFRFNGKKSPRRVDLKAIKNIFYNNCLKTLHQPSESCGISQSDILKIINKKLGSDFPGVISSDETKILSSVLINPPSHKRRRSSYLMFSSEAKQFCLDMHSKEGLSVELISLLCCVPLKSLKRWAQVGWERKKGCGRKIRDPQLEQKLLQWYYGLLKEKKFPTPMMIRSKALELSQSKSFMASKGWFEKFKKKYNIYAFTKKDLNEMKKVKEGCCTL